MKSNKNKKKVGNLDFQQLKTQLSEHKVKEKEFRGECEQEE